MSHVPGAAGFAAAGQPEERSGARPAERAGLPWRTYARCFLLAAVVASAGYVAFRPALLRLSILLSLVSPSRGENLSVPWTDEPDGALRPAPQKFAPPPDEWRLAAAHTAGWSAERPGDGPADGWRGGAPGAAPWRRESFNPWSWSDDAARAARRGEDQENLPGQKAESSFRTPVETPPAETAAARNAPVTAQQQPSAFAGATPDRVPSVAPLAPLPAIVHTAPEAEPEATPETAAAPSALSRMPDLRLPPLPSAQPAQPAESTPAPSEPVVSEPITLPESAESVAPATITPAEALSSAMEQDWKEREITAPVPGAYLTIYPKLNFVGLCVPGQGYIRKYNQIAVPMDLTLPKAHADDGRTPYGKYYVVDHVRDAAGPRVVLSWPSVEDAGRAGAGPEMLAEIDRAWSAQALPPQDSVAGGGLSLSGDRATTDHTSGGFSLEAPHMEEIFTALPDGAWVFVQQ